MKREEPEPAQRATEDIGVGLGGEASWTGGVSMCVTVHVSGPK